MCFHDRKKHLKKLNCSILISVCLVSSCSFFVKNSLHLVVFVFKSVCGRIWTNGANSHIWAYKKEMKRTMKADSLPKHLQIKLWRYRTSNQQKWSKVRLRKNKKQTNNRTRFSLIYRPHSFYKRIKSERGRFYKITSGILSNQISIQRFSLCILFRTEAGAVGSESIGCSIKNQIVVHNLIRLQVLLIWTHEAASLVFLYFLFRFPFYFF